MSSLLGPLGECEVHAIEAMTLDGSATLGATSEQLGNAADARLLHELRAWSDVILVGAQTVRAEGYGPVAGPTRLAIVSASLDIPVHLRDSLIVAPPEAHAPGLDIVHVKELPQAIDALRARGYRRIAVEGGPRIYGALLAADLVDVFHLTLHPAFAGSSHTPAVAYPLDTAARPFDLEFTQVSDDGVVFLRYRRSL